MKVSDLINRLQEAQERVGDVKVYVGEASSVKRSLLDVNSGVDYSIGEEPSIVVQAYVKLT